MKVIKEIKMKSTEKITEIINKAIWNLILLRREYSSSDSLKGELDNISNAIDDLLAIYFDLKE